MKSSRMVGLLGLLTLLAGGLGGCQDQLFTGNDSYHQSAIDKYYGRDSAVEKREERLHAPEMGFGYPSGMANQ